MQLNWRDTEIGTVLKRWHIGKFELMIRRGFSSLCAYVGVPIGDPLIGTIDPDGIDCHGGITFSADNDGEDFPAGYHWYGWDYGHAFDELCFAPSHRMITHNLAIYSIGTRKWEVDKVASEVEDVANQFMALDMLRKEVDK